MPFSHPSAAAVESSPGRPAPPETQARPFLNLIERAYRSEGQRVPAQVLAPPADELTIPRAHTDWCDDDDFTVEDRPSHRQRRSMSQETTPGFRRGLFVDPATCNTPRPAVDASDAALQRELCSLPVVVGNVIPRGARGQPQPPRYSGTEKTLVRRQWTPCVSLPILKPVDEARAPVGPPPLPSFAIPPDAVVPGQTTTATDPHGRIYSAEGLIFVDTHLGEIDLDDIDLGLDVSEPEAFDPELFEPEVLAVETSAPVVHDDTDPFACVLALQTEFDSQSNGWHAQDHTIELSPGLLHDLLLLEERDPILVGGKTVPDLRLYVASTLAAPTTVNDN